MESLPEELVSNVLSRLPAKHLIRCKCVCKSWYHLIIDPRFISNYYLFYNNLQDQQQKLLVIRNNKQSSFLLPPSFYNTKISVLSWNPIGIVSSQFINPPPNHQCGIWGPLIMGPCNGIYFLEGNSSVIMNPSLSQFITLPQCQLPPPHGTYSICKYPNFGYDPKTNDYKVVVISEHWLDEPRGPQIQGDWSIELYSLNSNSWRNLDAPPFPFPFVTSDIFGFCTYVNNSCHWRGYLNEFERYNNDAENVVMSFDMVTELFRIIKVPQSTHSRGLCSELTTFTESATIGLVVYPCPVSRGTEDNFCFDVWMMKDYWDDDSWVKRYSVSMPTIYKRIVGFYGSNRFLWKDANDTLVLYGLDYDDHARELQVYGNHDSIRAVRYMESIVSLQRGN